MGWVLALARRPNRGGEPNVGELKRERRFDWGGRVEEEDWAGAVLGRREDGKPRGFEGPDRVWREGSDEVTES